MKKLLLVVGLAALFGGPLYSKTTEWKETTTTFTQFLQMEEYKIVEVSYEKRGIIYHIRGLKEFIICNVKINSDYVPQSTTCYYEDW
tara:strand:+ start:96 stop:356 length:261 start_codon:yes stop_codon:yes gene_type:complete